MPLKRKVIGRNCCADCKINEPCVAVTLMKVLGVIVCPETFDDLITFQLIPISYYN